MAALRRLFQPWGDAASVPAPAAPLPLAAESDLAALCRAAGFSDPEGWAAALHRPMRTYGISGQHVVAAFLATVAHETGGGRRLVESLDYAPAGLLATWPGRFSPDLAQRLGRSGARPADQVAIAERAYGDRMGNGPEGDGDGWRYRGRGAIQITGRANYAAAAQSLGVRLADLPAWMETREGAATSAAWWWSAHGCSALATAGDVAGWRRRVNGGLNGLADVQRRYDAVLAV